MSLLIVATLVAVAALLAAEQQSSRTGRWLTKPVASTGFVAVALVAGATDHGYGMLVLAGLLLSWFGDVFLIPEERPAVFQAGIASFMLAHVAYAIAFCSLGPSSLALAVAAGVMIGPALAALRWLRPHVPDELKPAAYAYIVVISVMVSCAFGASAATGRWALFVGAMAFCISDVAVARDRFVEAGFVNRLWGLPLYYVAQLVLASTVASR